jgi:hypothetical protein
MDSTVVKIIAAGLIVFGLVGASRHQVASTANLDGHAVGAVGVGTAIVYNNNNKPDVSPDVERHPREKCPTGGWMQTDGKIKIRCNLCDPPWTASDEAPKEAPVEVAPVVPELPELPPQPEPESEPEDDSKKTLRELGLKWHTQNGKCCPDCTCQECNCRYPGQCLVEKNHGSDVTVYGQVCRGRFCQMVPIRTYSANKPMQVHR